MAHEITPFELALRHEVEEDYMRMANGWFFKWHNINIPNRVVEVEDFYGGNFAVGGIVFQGQIRDLYWRSVGKHLVDRVHRGFKQWEAASAAYPPNLKKCSLDALEHILNGYIAKIAKRAVETDRALRGRGDPRSVEPYDDSGYHAQANAEVMRLKAAHTALLPKEEAKEEKVSLIRKVEEHLTKWRGVYAGVGLLLAVAGLIARMFF